VYALPKNHEDLTLGWKEVKVKDEDTLAERKLADLTTVAFALLDAEDPDAKAEFHVDIPTPYDDEL
jgi:hypothetical protein